MEQQLWRPASVMYDDLVGTVAADFPDNLRDLLHHADLGPDWIVVGLDLGGSYRSSWGAVLAFPMPDEGRYLSWERIAAEHDGSVPVRRFTLEQGDVRKALPPGIGLFTELKRWSVRMTIAALKDMPITVLVEG